MMTARLYLLTWAASGFPVEVYQEVARECPEVLERADALLLFRGKEAKPGEIARAHTLLAKAIAVLAYAPGGISIFGEHLSASEIAQQFNQQGEA